MPLSCIYFYCIYYSLFLTKGYGVPSDRLGKETEGVNLLKSIPSYSCSRSADVPLASRSEESPSPRACPRTLETNHPLLARKPIGRNSAR